jgi:hypothetical protein
MYAVRESWLRQEHEWAFTHNNVHAMLAAEVDSGLAHRTRAACTACAVHPDMSNSSGDTVANNRFRRRGCSQQECRSYGGLYILHAREAWRALKFVSRRINGNDFVALLPKFAHEIAGEVGRIA